AAANTSGLSAGYTATIDTAAPAAPVITGFTTDSGTVGDHITNDQTLTVDGTAEAGSRVTVCTHGTSPGTTTSTGNCVSHFIDTTTPTNGTPSPHAAPPIYAAANTSGLSAGYTATIDTAAPAAPVITGFTTDSGTVGDHITNDQTLTVDGTAE